MRHDLNQHQSTLMNIHRPEIRTVQVVAYIAPLREGGSLPAIVEAEDGFLYVLKFFGAGQGRKALIAELLGGEIARSAGLRVPELVFAQLDESFGRSEPDEEIQDLLRASRGLNLGLHYLSGSITYDPAVAMNMDAILASKIVWVDAFLTNVDRTARNTNMLNWNSQLWLIDHGASLYFHHNWNNREGQSVTRFTQIKDHVLLPFAQDLEKADEVLKKTITEETIKSIVSIIPNEWLDEDDPEIVKEVYNGFLINRLNHSSIFLKEALHAAAKL